jgi:hypothetical protein
MYVHTSVALNQGAPMQPTIRYFGGHVLSNVQVVPIFWGQFWTTSDGANLMAKVNSFYDSILISPWMSILAEYTTYDSSHNIVQKVGYGSRIPQSAITNSEPPNPLTGDNLATQLNAWIGSGVISSPNSNICYVVFTAPGPSNTFEDARTIGGIGVHISAISYYPSGGYPNWARSILDWYTAMATYYIADAVICPRLDGWVYAGYIGYSNSTPARLSNGYLVNQTWSNLQGGPVIAPR